MAKLRLLVHPTRSLLLLLLTGFLVFLLASGALPGLTYLGVGIIVFPALLLCVAALGGILPSALALLLMMLGALRVYGPDGLLLGVYLAPMNAVFLACLERKVPFFRTAALAFGAFVLSALFLFLLFQRRSGGDVYGAVAQSALDGLEGLPSRDSLLYALWRSGFISHGREAGAQVVTESAGGWTFKPEILEEFYKQIRVRVSALASALMPGLLTTFGIFLSTLGLGFAVHRGARRGACPDLGMPPFSLWHLPRSLGRKLWLLALGYLLAAFSQNAVLRLAGQMMYNVFFSVYAVQGLAALDFRMKARGTREGVRLLLMALLLVVLAPAAMLLGLFDQTGDHRRLRPRETQP